MRLITVPGPSPAAPCHLIGEAETGGRAVVIHPPTDLGVVEDVLVERRWACVLVLETGGPGADLTAGRELAHRTGAAYGLHGRLPADVDRCALRGGDLLTAGSLRVRALEPGGHAEGPLSYLITQDDQDALRIDGAGGMPAQARDRRWPTAQTSTVAP